MAVVLAALGAAPKDGMASSISSSILQMKNIRGNALRDRTLSPPVMRRLPDVSPAAARPSIGPESAMSLTPRGIQLLACNQTATEMLLMFPLSVLAAPIAPGAVFMCMATICLPGG